MAAEKEQRQGPGPSEEEMTARTGSGDVIRRNTDAHTTHVALAREIHTTSHAHRAQDNGTHMAGKDPAASGGVEDPIAALAGQSEARLFEEQRNYLEGRQQAQQAALLAQVAAEVGLLLVAGAAVLYGLGYTTVGVVTGVLSALAQALAAFFAGQVKNSGERMDRNHAAFVEAQRWDAALALIARMEEGPAKDRAVALLFEGLLRR